MPRASQIDRLQALLSAHGAGIRRVVRAYAPPADRADLEQDIALSLWRALPRFRGDCSERTFVFRVAHNRGVDYLRRRKPAASAGPLDALHDEGPRADAQLARAQRRAALADAITALPLIHRQVLTLALEDLSHAEIAAVLGVRPNTVSARLSRARRLLSARMKGVRDAH